MRSDFPGASGFIPPRTQPHVVAKRDPCRGCNLYRDATQAGVGDGPKNALVMVSNLATPRIDRANRSSDLRGGCSTQHGPKRAFFRKGFQDQRRQRFRFSQQGKRRIHVEPDLAHMVACTPWLVEELAIVQPTGVVLLGATAGRAVLGPKFRVGKARRPTDGRARRGTGGACA